MNRRIHLPQPDPVTRSARPAVARAASALSLDAMRTTDVRQLQAAAGNRAARTAASRTMEVGAANDAHEVEADAVAREIMSNSGNAQREAEGGEGVEEELQLKRVQREASEEDELQMKRIERASPEEDELQMKRIERASPEEDELQMKRIERASPEEEELQMKRIERYTDEEDVGEDDTAALQMKRLDRDAAPEVGMAGGAASADTSAAVESSRGGGQPLGEGIRREMEGQFGADFSAVRVHQDSQAADLNDRLSARAFTTGSDIFVGREGMNIGSRGGQELLAHELTHVVQQGAAGRKSRRRSN